MSKLFRHIIICILLLKASVGFSQPMNNEWINYNLTYYKFKIAADGLYRINQATLQSLGIAQANVAHYVLWRNGVEVPLYTSQQNGVLSSDGYLEFWGEANDGKPDFSLYRIGDHQLNDRWSLFSDSVSYFLAVDPAGNHLRLLPTVNSIPAGPSPMPYFLHTEGKYYRERINEGYAVVAGSYIYSSAFDQGEGWTTNDLGAGQQRAESFSSLRAYIGGNAPASQLKVNVAGNAPNSRTIEVLAGSNSLLTQQLSQFDYAKLTVGITSAQLASGNVTIAVKNNSAVSTDRIVIAKTELTYPRLFDFGGADRFPFNLPASSAEQYLEITGFNHGGVSPVLYDFTNGLRMEGVISGSVVKYNLPPSLLDRKLLMVSASPTLPRVVSGISPRNFTNYGLSSNQGDYLIITHPALFTTSGGVNVIEEYRQYRNSLEGGNYQARTYLIDQLEDQFAFGIKRHPNAVRNFIRWARANYSRPIQSVFLIGKGVLYPVERGNESNPDLPKLSFVPSFGSPASDLLLASDPGPNLIPRVPIGRLSVINGDEVAVYLAKVKQAELAQRTSSPLVSDKGWMKNVVHIIGISEEALGAAITGSMNRFGNIIADSFYGARINTFSKLSPAPVALLSSQKIYNLFEEGIGLMTYFGHSTANTLEYNLDNPEGYNNQGKYPFYIMLGCRAGNLFNFTGTRLIEKETISERFVLADQRGGIATIASTSLGLVNYLDIYNEQLMKTASVYKYGATIGEIMQEAVNRNMAITGQGDFFARLHCEQSALNGDPVLRLHSNFTKPDFVVEAPQVSVTPAFVSVADNQFIVNARLLNIGRAINGPVTVELRRTYPSGQTELIKRDTLRRFFLEDSLRYTIPIVASRDKVLNSISICIDPEGRYEELYETNNCFSKEFYIYEDELRPLYPLPYAIIGRQNIVFKASTANPFSPARNYQFQLDTTALFNSPLSVSLTVNATGGLIEFSPGITYRDSVVYYWRVAPVVTTGPPVWNTASFIYLNGQPNGFNQSHFFQHQQSTAEKLLIDPSTRDWKFTTRQNNLNLRSGVYFTATSAFGGFYLGLNGVDLATYACNRNRIIINVLHPVTMRPVLNAPPGSPGRFGSDPICVQTGTLGNGAEYNFQFRPEDTAVRRRMVDFLDSIPNGYYVIVRNLMETNYPTNAYAANWKDDQLFLGTGNSIYHRLKEQGFTDIDSFNRNRVFAFIYKKNDVNRFAARSAFSVGAYDQLFYSVDLPSVDTLATLTSPQLGPASTWQELRWKGEAELPLNEQVSLSVIGIKNDGSSSTLISAITPTQPTVSLSSIDAATYPYLQLKLTTSDTSHLTPFQLQHWRVLYQPVPEGALAPNEFLLIKDTVEVGEPFVFKMAFRNTSEKGFDSLRVKMIITDRNNVSHTVVLPKKRPIPVGDSVHIGTQLNTAVYPGQNTIYLEANPENDQPEQFHFNNFAYHSLYVRPDSMAPLLDVTFDGIHILNRDVVSSKPAILIQLRDESKWMLLNDTALFSVQVRFPNGVTRPYYFNTDTLRLIPAQQAGGVNNLASLQFAPYFTEDGVYELFVTAKDRSGNKAGDLSYRIQFEVISRSMISNLLNYPNPFTSSTAFVFTITGQQIPQQLKIEILTITGKIVREITKAELGSLRIGRNITEFKWDGTDQFGQPLANGIYLYRVVARLDGQEMEKYRASGDRTDPFFNKGYGKMYLLR